MHSGGLTITEISKIILVSYISLINYHISLFNSVSLYPCRNSGGCSFTSHEGSAIGMLIQSIASYLTSCWCWFANNHFIDHSLILLPNWINLSLSCFHKMTFSWTTYRRYDISAFLQSHVIYGIWSGNGAVVLGIHHIWFLRVRFEVPQYQVCMVDIKLKTSDMAEKLLLSKGIKIFVLLLKLFLTFGIWYMLCYLLAYRLPLKFCIFMLSRNHRVLCDTF